MTAHTFEEGILDSMHSWDPLERSMALPSCQQPPFQQSPKSPCYSQRMGQA